MIGNPEYKGTWSLKRISNPRMTADASMPTSASSALPLGRQRKTHFSHTKMWPQVMPTRRIPW